MVSLPINVVIKTKSLDNIPEILDNLKRIKEDKPNSVIKITIRVVSDG